MTVFLYFLIIVWVIRIAAETITFVQLWFVKEYRFDRMRIHLRTAQGKRLFFLPFKRPPITIKSISVIACTLLVLYLIYMLLPYHILWRLSFLDLISFPVTALFVAIFRIPTAFIHKWKIQKAVAVLRAHSKMTVIGITGSYGKTSTKEILSTLLSGKFDVLKTPASKNSPIAIAELLLSSLTSQKSAFVVEMGAYMKGEIAQMCEMVRPEIAIVTAINPQHQDLFGTIEQTVEAKYELISGLTGAKNVIINADNPYTLEMGKRAQTEGCAVLFYSVKKSDIAGIHATNIKTETDRLLFTIVYKEKSYPVSVSLLGAHHASNIIASVGACLATGMDITDILSRFSQISAFDHTMKKLQGVNGSIFIDDTFNNNPDAALAAISYLNEYKKRKILVFQPMIELGAFSAESHKKVGIAAAQNCDDIILTNDNFYDDFISGIRDIKEKEKIHVMTVNNAGLYIRTHMQSGDVVLFKGKESARILRELC